MSSASSSTVTASNARRHTATTSTQSSRAAVARARHSPSSVSGNSHSSYRGAPARSDTFSGTATPRASDNGDGGVVNNNNRIPITPTVLRNIFARSRTLFEERTISRVAFFRYVLRFQSFYHFDRYETSIYWLNENIFGFYFSFAGFLLSCLGISLAAARRRPITGLGLNG